MTAKFGSRIGLIAATVGSAVGLGNVWRFPAEVQQNGGAAFLLIYIGCILLFGIPVMTSEFVLGRGSGANAVDAFSKVTPNRPRWRLIGLLGVLSAYAILSFYMVVSGWTLEYFIESVTGALYEPVPGISGEDAQFAAKMSQYVQGTWSPLTVTWIMLAANAGILMLGVQKGIERVSNVLMPVLFVLLLAFCAVSLSLPGASDGLKFFLSPDFSKITPATFINALGQAFFSLSLGMGALVTYSSYFPAKTPLIKTAVTVSALDLMVAFLMGLIIFPAVTTFGLADHDLAGSSLVFITLPEIFAQMSATRLWSSLFFLLLMVAAFTSTLSLGEVATAYIQERFRLSRVKATLAVVLPLIALSAAASLSLGGVSSLSVLGTSFFDILDNATTNIMLPLGSLGLCIYMGWVAPKKFFQNQTSRGFVSSLIYRIIKYFAPILILLIMICNLW